MKKLSVLKDGEWREVDDKADYTVALSDWIANGGDRFFVFREVPKELTEVRDLDVLLDYLSTFPNGRVDMKTDGRITIEGQ